MLPLLVHDTGSFECAQGACAHSTEQPPGGRMRCCHTALKAAPFKNAHLPMLQTAPIQMHQCLDQAALH